MNRSTHPDQLFDHKWRFFLREIESIQPPILGEESEKKKSRIWTSNQRLKSLPANQYRISTDDT